MGFNCEKVRGTAGKAKGVSFNIWDVGGQDKVRPLWRSYARGTDGIVFVVDSRDQERMDEARAELYRMCRAPEAAGAPVLVIANKQDLPGARSPQQLEVELGMSELLGRSWTVRPGCAVTGEGLDEALEQLYHMVVKKRKSAKNAKRKQR